MTLRYIEIYQISYTVGQCGEFSSGPGACSIQSPFKILFIGWHFLTNLQFWPVTADDFLFKSINLGQQIFKKHLILKSDACAYASGMVAWSRGHAHILDITRCPDY